MSEKIIDIGLRILLSWTLIVRCIGVDLLLLFILIRIFQDIFIGGIFLSIPVITFIIIFSITCFHVLISSWKN